MTARELLRDAAMWFEGIARGDAMEGRRALHEQRVAALRALAARFDQEEAIAREQLNDRREGEHEGEKARIWLLKRLDAPLEGR